MTDLAADQQGRQRQPAGPDAARGECSRTDTPTASVSTRAALGAGWVMAWRLATRNLGLVSTLILVRLLQPSDFGLIALASGFIASVDALSAIGVQDALIRAPNLNRAMYDTGFTIGVLRSIATAAIIGAIAWPTGLFFDDPRLAVVMLALAFGTFLSGFENIGIVDFRRELAFRKEFSLSVWPRVAGVAITVGVAIAWQSYWAMMIGVLFARIVRLPLTYTMAPYRPSFTLRAWRELIGFSLWTWAQTLLFQARERADMIIIGRFMSTRQVGVFTVGVELGLLPVTELIEPLARALFPGFALLHNRGETLRGMFLGSIGAGFLLVLPAGVGISMVAYPMVRLTLGEQWADAVPLIQIMGVCGILGLINQICTAVLNAVGRPNEVFHVCAATAVVKIPLLCVLVIWLGVTGAAAGLLLINVAELGLFLSRALPIVGVSLLEVADSMLRPLVAAGVMVLTLWPFGIAWTPAHGSSFQDICADAILRCGLGAIAYVIALAAAWLLAGRPDGAERFILNMAGKIWNSCRGYLRSAKGSVAAG